jgi:S-adenosylmethionine decarboxylase proenzyme
MAEFFGCDDGLLNNREMIEKVMNSAAQACGATVVSSVVHLFNPHGISGVVVIAESHLAIHTWPEFRYASVDVFTCGDSVDPWVAVEYLQTHLHAQTASTVEVQRGELDVDNGQLFPGPPHVVDQTKEMRV